MKSGAGDDPFDDEPADASTDQTPDTETVTDPDPTPMSNSETAPQQHSLPYIHSRDSVKEGREQKPIFLRDPGVVEDLVDEMEDRIGEDVFKTDVLEAAVLAAQSNPEILEDELREWGYGWE